MSQSEQNSKDVSLGRFLSLILRHKPELAGITLDAHGWANVDELIKGCRRAGKAMDRETLERIVQENNKQRYSFNEDQSKIRANQGHSISVDLELKEELPPARLYHGTATRFLEQIRTEGIQKGSRQYVHLSQEKATARQVGSRHGTPVILPIDTEKMLADGCHFYRSANGVWLCEQIPWRYVVESEIPSRMN